MGQLHWLPIQRRKDFKVARLVYQSSSGQALVDLADDINPVVLSDGRLLRSAMDSVLQLTETETEKQKKTKLKLKNIN